MAGERLLHSEPMFSPTADGGGLNPREELLSEQEKYSPADRFYDAVKNTGYYSWMGIVEVNGPLTGANLLVILARNKPLPDGSVDSLPEEELDESSKSSDFKAYNEMMDAWTELALANHPNVFMNMYIQQGTPEGITRMDAAVGSMKAQFGVGDDHVKGVWEKYFDPEEEKSAKLIKPKKAAEKEKVQFAGEMIARAREYGRGFLEEMDEGEESDFLREHAGGEFDEMVDQEVAAALTEIVLAKGRKLGGYLSVLELPVEAEITIRQVGVNPLDREAVRNITMDDIILAVEEGRLDLSAYQESTITKEK